MRQRTELFEESDGYISHDNIFMCNIDKLSKLEFQEKKKRLPELVDFTGEININPTAFLQAIETFKKLKVDKIRFKLVSTYQTHRAQIKQLFLTAKTPLLNEVLFEFRATKDSENNDKTELDCHFSTDVLYKFIKSFKKEELLAYDYINIQLGVCYPIWITLKSDKEEIKNVWILLAPIITND